MANERESIKLTPKNIAELGGGYVVYENDRVTYINYENYNCEDYYESWQYDSAKLIIPAQIFIQQNS